MIKPNMIAILKINDITVNNAMIVPSNIIKKDIQKTESGDFKEFLFIAEESDSITSRLCAGNMGLLYGLPL